MEVPDGDVQLASGDASPASSHYCGQVFWCCYRIACGNGQIWKNYDVPICPKQYQRPETRAAAWKIWEPKVIAILFYADGETRSVCGIQEATCSYEPQGAGICWTYPN